MTQDRSPQVGIIGAGIAGLTAARHLQENGVPCVVWDKGRGVGGRMSTRRIGDAVADHGAQYFTARSADFGATTVEAQQAGAVTEWANMFPGPHGEPATSSTPRWRGSRGMNHLPKHLADGLHVETSHQVTAIRRNGAGWKVRFGEGPCAEVSQLIVTCPVPQAVVLLDAGDVAVEATLRAELEAVQYAPCFAVMAVLEGPSAIPSPGGVVFESGPITWIADNQQKGISPVPCVTIHASPAFTREHLDDDREQVGWMLLAHAALWIGSAVREVQVHRWLFSLVERGCERPFGCISTQPALLLAGDAFGGRARVEDAALSGLAAAKKLIALSAAAS